MSAALRTSANTNTSPADFHRGQTSPSAQHGCAPGAGEVVTLPGNSRTLVEEGPAPAGPLRPLHESLNAVLTRLIDTRAEEAVGGTIPWHRPETPRPGEFV
jgi:hypothetical protein